MSGAGFKDHFSDKAAAYGRYRPHYPPSLFQALARRCAAREAAWDCGCGNGQAAVALADHFARVFATDASAEQIDNAFAHPQVAYSVAPAEQSGLEDECADLITVAQAIHWFDFDAFYEEVRRVGKAGGLLAVISYGLFKVAPALDEVLSHLHSTTLAPYWPPERRFVDENLKTIPFPFAEAEAPPMELRAEWRLEDLVGYIETWSALQRYRNDRAEDPLPAVAEDLAAHWGEPEQTRLIRWPLNLRLGRLP